MRKLAALVLLAASSARADPSFELGRSDKGRRWQIGEGTETVLVAVDAKARATAWDSSFHDDAVAEARRERQQELGGGLAFAGIVAIAAGLAIAGRDPAHGMAIAGGGWLGLGVGSFAIALGAPDAPRRQHHHH